MTGMGRGVRIVFICFILGSLAVWAADSYRVNSGATVSVSEHGMCRSVQNTGVSDLFVPTKTLVEFQSFITNKPTYVNLTTCCPTGFVAVPGNASYGTPDFCVMQYEAKDVGGVATSQANGAPWLNITFAAARRKCQALGPTYDLISNDHWQTIYHDVEYVNANWSGGSRGVGCLFLGNNNWTDACGYNGNDPPSLDSGTSRNSKARFTLSNGEIIWDMSGNAGEWVNGNPAAGTTQSYTYGNQITGSGKTWYGPKGTYTTCASDPTGYCGLGWMDVGGPAYYTIMRGGGYDDAGGGGIGWIHSSQGAVNWAHDWVGFRCVSDPRYTTSTCNGTSVGGYCWYLGPGWESCDGICYDNGGYNAATLSYAGSGGSNANCQAVLDALKAPGTGAPSTTASAAGCHVNGTTRRRGTTATTGAASGNNVFRACACNQ